MKIFNLHQLEDKNLNMEKKKLVRLTPETKSENIAQPLSEKTEESNIIHQLPIHVAHSDDQPVNEKFFPS